jgi:hypothetical protein
VKKWRANAHLRTELDLFAGQLYFDSEQEYRRMCVLLALHMAHPGANTYRGRWLRTFGRIARVLLEGRRLPPVR